MIILAVLLAVPTLGMADVVTFQDLYLPQLSASSPQTPGGGWYSLPESFCVPCRLRMSRECSQWGSAKALNGYGSRERDKGSKGPS